MQDLLLAFKTEQRPIAEKLTILFPGVLHLLAEPKHDDVLQSFVQFIPRAGKDRFLQAVRCVIHMLFAFGFVIG